MKLEELCQFKPLRKHGCYRCTQCRKRYSGIESLPLLAQCSAALTPGQKKVKTGCGGKSPSGKQRREKTSFLGRMGGLAAATAKFVKSGLAIATDEEAKQRLNICNDCEHFDEGLCSQCGCWMLLKTKLAAMTCPLPEPKWGPINAAKAKEKES